MLSWDSWRSGLFPLPASPAWSGSGAQGNLVTWSVRRVTSPQTPENGRFIIEKPNAGKCRHLCTRAKAQAKSARVSSVNLHGLYRYPVPVTGTIPSIPSIPVLSILPEVYVGFHLSPVPYRYHNRNSTGTGTGTVSAPLGALRLHCRCTSGSAAAFDWCSAHQSNAAQSNAAHVRLTGSDKCILRDANFREPGSGPAQA